MATLPLPSVGIPVVHRTDTPYKGRGKWVPGRMYTSAPLPIKLSDQAPQKARITGRVADDHGVFYSVKTGEVQLTDVGVDEILEYVSPLYLEQYENAQFVEEREVLAALETEKLALKMERLERQKERAKTKGTVLFEDVESGEDGTDGESSNSGAHGRARPTYSHLFKLAKERRRRKRDPQTGHLMPLSDEDEEREIPGRGGDNLPPSFAREPGHFVQLPYKRRRRKRDKATGELLPLSPIAQQIEPLEKKRRRRRRHPISGELMPLGWKYDPGNNAEGEAGIDVFPASQSLRKLSLIEGHEAKRPRLASEDSGILSPSPPRGRQRNTGSPHKPAQHAAQSFSSPQRDRPSLRDASAESHRGRTMSERPNTPSDVERSSQSPEAELRTSIMRPTARWKMSTSPLPFNPSQSKASVRVSTSIFSPSARLGFSSSAPVSDADEVVVGEENDEDEWEVENIYEHRYSDPKTHPPGVGNAPVMLYRTKWIGSDELTWEPLISFGDWDIVRSYRRRIGLRSEPSDAGSRKGEDIGARGRHLMSDEERDPILATGETDDSGSASEAQSGGGGGGGGESEMDANEYEFEAILSHHLSDPRSHPPSLGKNPVMLYLVKWKGWEEPTWEPVGSFEDAKMVDAYRNRVGLKGQR